MTQYLSKYKSYVFTEEEFATSCNNTYERLVLFIKANPIPYTMVMKLPHFQHTKPGFY